MPSGGKKTPAAAGGDSCVCQPSTSVVKSPCASTGSSNEPPSITSSSSEVEVEVDVLDEVDVEVLDDELLELLVEVEVEVEVLD